MLSTNLIHMQWNKLSSKRTRCILAARLRTVQVCMGKEHAESAD